MEKLETVCDDIAFAIDDVDGALTREQIEVLVSEALEPTEYNREQFDEMFENIYRCDVQTYASNATDDANWATENGLLDSYELLFDPEELEDIDPVDLGITVVTDDEFY